MHQKFKIAVIEFNNKIGKILTISNKRKKIKTQILIMKIIVKIKNYSN